MAQDEYFLNSSGGGGGHGGGGGGDGSNSNNHNDKSKNNFKQKKVPQRGLGVAQLERLRLEEQRNREAVQVHNPPNFGPNMIPVQAVDALTNNAIGLVYDPIPDIILAPQALDLNFGPLCRPVARPPGPSWYRMWGVEYNNNIIDGGEGDKQRVDDHHDDGFTFGPQINLNLPYEPNGPGLPVGFQFQRPPSSSVTVGIGTKRAYPFNLERRPPPQIPSPHSSFRAWVPRSDGNKSIGDGHLILTPSPEQIPVEDTRLIGDFLTLAPPVTASTPPSLKNKHPLDFDLSDNRSLSSQENLRSRQGRRVGPSASAQQTFTFFPIKPQTDQTQTRARVRNIRDNNEEKEEKLDLDLKL